MRRWHFWKINNIFVGKGQNYKNHNVENQKELWKLRRRSERQNGLFSWSECQKANYHNVKKQIITTSKRVDHYYKYHNVEKNEKNVKSLIFVWFSHFNYLWRILTTYGIWVLWTPGVKKWIFKSSLAW
jgi:hypothetical protein